MTETILISPLRRLGVALLLATMLVGCNQSNIEHPGADKNDFSNRADIIGGEIKIQRNTPASRSVVLIELLDEQLRPLTFCTATLIGAHTILTAGHCFDVKLIGPVKKFRVLFENFYKPEGPREQRQGLAYLVNPTYNSRGIYDHDIALGVFAGALPAGFAPVSIDENINANYANELVFAYGYGRTKDYTGQRAEDLRYSSGTLFRGILKVDPWFKETPDRYFTLNEWPTHLCQGDSGGPQFLDRNGELKVIGVNSASFGKKLPNGIQDCSGKSQATKVAPFAGWLHKEERKLLRMISTTEF
ncbi:S1 family peptidase [Bdellovibrio svalbardensis]|uniref:S1 family peptidase n=1 Tax=Bdellovibrio svalbardensis TaxID=2972972 RepID=A0ABT6DM40_9BACT|nr:S1 family peptidase [Bdellovibrio svalbardensis]MDG0817949.1 S1 family peptidase [Bdellovibrio svalbardensis]